MECNVGKEDRIIRAVIGIAALYLGYTMSPWFYIIAAIGLVTAAVGICPTYSIIKVSTCKVHPAKSKKK